MAKTFLKIDGDEQYDFLLIGIVCQHKDYRLCHELNTRLALNLERGTDFEIQNNKRMKSAAFPFFEYMNEDGDIYYVFANKGKDDWLIPEQRSIDYFLMIKENFKRINEQELANEIKEIPIVLGVYPMEIRKLKSKDNLVF
jgi:hypothetical protein